VESNEGILVKFRQVAILHNTCAHGVVNRVTKKKKKNLKDDKQP
jgi:NADPH-dependent 7-cyano-7-deazaguanine reductase QueF